MAHMLKKTEIMQSNKTKTEHSIQFLFHFADTGKKNFTPPFSGKYNSCTWIQISSVLKFASRDSDCITCRWVRVTRSPTKHTEALLFSNKYFADMTFHFKKGLLIKALTFVAGGSTSLWRCRAEPKWLFWGAPSWQWTEKGEEKEEKKGGKWIVEGMEWRMLEKGEEEYLTRLYFH